MSASCAFADCQAGGTILDTAPRYVGGPEVGHTNSSVLARPSMRTISAYHPGCWAALCQAAQAPASEHAWHAEDRPCRCADKHDRACSNLAGADGWCDNCRDGSGPDGHEDRG